MTLVKDEKKKKNTPGNDTTSMAPAKPWLTHNPGTCPEGKKTRNSRTHFSRIRKIKEMYCLFPPVHLDKGTLDTAAWIVFVGVLRSKQRWKTKRAVPLKTCALQARLFLQGEKDFPSALGGQ